MASTSSLGLAECEHIDIPSQVNVVGDEPASPLSERIHDIPHGIGSTATVLERSSRFQFLATWLLGHLRHTCGLLGYLAACLTSVQVDQRHQESNITNNSVKQEPASQIVNNSTVAESELNLESKHKVFLSHSGAQKDFVEQLCVDLERCDRYSFFDKRRWCLPIGKEFPKLIFDAIEQCHVGVVVLSKQFFMSKWPMLELNAMVKKANAKITIVPVFYCISVEEVKNPTNLIQWTSQWEEWALNDDRINIVEWKKAIKKLGPINGIVMKKGFGDVQLREDIVAQVCGLVPRETRWDDSHVQGCSRICKVIRDKINEMPTNSRVCVVGLYGMGGIGKTTISKALCNDFSPKFCNIECHIELGSGSELELLRKALKKLTGVRHDILDKLDDIGEGYPYLKKLYNQSILLVLDNVQDDLKGMEIAQRYLKASYGSGSIVLVTTRSLNVLEELNINGSNCLEMPELGEDEARSLFLDYANLPVENQVEEILINDCIERCHFFKSDGSSKHYHPLALKVLGQQLGRNPTKWAAQLMRIKTFNQRGEKEHPIFSILRNSFDSLKLELQFIFMDLALFVAFEFDDPDTGNSKRDWLCMVHEASVEDMKEMLTVLKGKSLVEELSDDFSEIGMHDLWIEFAVAETKAHNFKDRWMYQVDGKKGALGRSGRWRENVERMCFLNEGWKALEGQNLNDFVNIQAFGLSVGGYVPDFELELDLSGLKRLRSLVVCTSALTVRADGLSSLTNLAFLIYETPGFSPFLEEIGRIRSLQVLELWRCKGVQVLDLTELRLLKTANIDGLPDLIAVKGLSSRLANLRFLRIICCKSLRECSGVGDLSTLVLLDFQGCGKLDELPCLGRLTNLRELNIDKCKSIRAVPGLSDLVTLEEFRASGCSKLAMLPDLAKLTKLQELDIWSCPVQEVPCLDGLISLTIFHAFFGMLLGEQPAFSRLSQLKVVNIEGWNGPLLTSTRSLLMLEDLRLWHCTGEDVVPDLQNLKRLQLVGFLRCEYKDLSGLSNSTALETLLLDDCDKLERLPEFERLTKLSELSITDCVNVRDWPSESTLCALECIHVDGSSLMKIVRELDSLTGLQELRLSGSGCENVMNRASLIPQLEILGVNKCSTMEALDVSNFPRLEELELTGSSELKRMICSKPLAALTELKVIDCESLVEMPDLSMFPHLEELQLKKCRAVTGLTCSSPLTALEWIKLIGCDSLIEFPDSRMFPNLRWCLVEEHYSSDDDEGEDDDFYGEADDDGDDDGDDHQVED